MGTWIFMLISDLLIPAAMIGMGYLFWKHTPKEINGAFGYRTSMSMKNQDTWRFAHHYSGKLWFRWGLLLIPVTVAAMCTALGKGEEAAEQTGLALCFLLMLPLIGVLIPTERALRKNFDKEGKRKTGKKDEEQEEQGKWF